MTDFTEILETFSKTEYQHCGQPYVNMLMLLSGNEWQAIKDNLSDVKVVDAVLAYRDSTRIRKAYEKQFMYYMERCVDFTQPPLDYLSMMSKQELLRENLNRARFSEQIDLRGLYEAIYGRGPPVCSL
jgi:hypothetical protein